MRKKEKTIPNYPRPANIPKHCVDAQELNKSRAQKKSKHLTNMVDLSSLLGVCPDGAWVTEDCAVEVLELDSTETLKQKFAEGSLPHVHVEHGKRVDAPPPYSQHHFFFIQKEGTSANRPSLGLAQWVAMCFALEGPDLSLAAEVVKRYMSQTDIDVSNAYDEMIEVRAVTLSLELSDSGSDDGDDGYNYGSSGGKVPSKASADGEIYVRADGKRVRRVKRASSAAAGGTSLARFLSGGARKTKGESRLAQLSGSNSVDGEIYVREDGTKVRRVLKASSQSVNSEGPKKSLGGFLGKHTTPNKLAGSNSVAGDQLAVSKDESLTGEVYVRADGKKVRRVRRTAAAPGDNVEIITRPDGTKVRRIRRKKPLDDGSTTSGGYRHLEGDIYIRPDGKKVRRVRKVAAGSSASASGDSTNEGKDQNYEIITRPDGTQVRRIRKTAKNNGERRTLFRFLQRNTDQKKPKLGGSASVDGDQLASNKRTLGGFLGNKNSKKLGGSASVAGDQLAIGKESSLTGEVYVRADGKKVRRINRAATTQPGDQVEIITRPDGTKVRRIRRIAQRSGADDQSGTSGQHAIGEIYIRADGKKVRRIRKTIAPGSDDQYEIYTRPDGKKVRRIRRAPPASAKTSSLSAGDEEIATQYRKMMKMGMPEGAVSQKMAIDGIPQHIVQSVLSGEASPPEPTKPAVKVSSLSPADEETATQYRKMLKMGMPEGAVAQKMTVDGAPQNIVDSVLAGEVPASECVLVPKEQAERTIPEGMVAVPKDKAVPEGFVLVPKEKIKGDLRDDLVLVNKDQVKDNTKIFLMSGDNPNLKDTDDNSDVDIEGANIVSMDDLPMRIEDLKREGDGYKPRFLIQTLPSDSTKEQDFIKKNLLPKEAARAPAPAAPSATVAELLAQMSQMGGDFDMEKMGPLLQKLEDAEKRQKKLEKQLAAAGVAIAEDIDYDICIKKIEQIGKRMNEIGGSDVTHPDKAEQNRLREEYFKLEQDMEKYNSALLLTDEYQKAQELAEKKWEEENLSGNLDALKKLRRHMPVEVRNMSEAQLTSEPSPNGKYLPKDIAKKFKRTNVLQLIRRNPDDIQRMHPSTLENMRITGMTLTERRALYEHVRLIGPQWKAMKAEKMTERKWIWYSMMRSNFKESLASYKRHVEQYGPLWNHQGCPLIGKQCPLRADKTIDYSQENYGWPEGPVYEVSEVRKAAADDPGAKAMQEAMELMKEKKASERGDALKKHYKGKLLQVSKANGSCEQMDEMVDKMEFGMMKWVEDILRMGNDKSKLTEDVKKKELAKYSDVLNDCKLSTLDICGRSGMQLSGKKGGAGKPDPRSVIECSLAEEVSEMFDVFAKFVSNRLKQTGIIDTRVRSTIEMLKGLLAELRQRNVRTIKKLGAERLPRSRPLKTHPIMIREIHSKIKGEGPAKPAGGGGPSLPGPPRGGLMDAIKGGEFRKVFIECV